MKKDGIPGPGKYEPNIQVAKRKFPAYSIGEKCANDHNGLIVCTNQNIGPGSYSIENCKKPSKSKDDPIWTIPKSQRPINRLKVWTKVETYAIPSSVGDQRLSRKNTQPKYTFGKANRDNNKVGIFPTMMSQKPATIKQI